jgi:hypothetical protein
VIPEFGRTSQFTRRGYIDDEAALDLFDRFESGVCAGTACCNGRCSSLKEVKLYSRSSPNSKPSKREGFLNLDKVGEARVFVAENRVLLTIPYPWVKNLNYEPKNTY